jgi:hypothetical protein
MLATHHWLADVLPLARRSIGQALRSLVRNLFVYTLISAIVAVVAAAAVWSMLRPGRGWEDWTTLAATGLFGCFVLAAVVWSLERSWTGALQYVVHQLEMAASGWRMDLADSKPQSEAGDEPPRVLEQWQLEANDSGDDGPVPGSGTSGRLGRLAGLLLSRWLPRHADAVRKAVELLGQQGHTTATPQLFQTALRQLALDSLIHSARRSGFLLQMTLFAWTALLLLGPVAVLAAMRWL